MPILIHLGRTFEVDTIAPKKTEVRGSGVPRELQIASYDQKLNCKVDTGVKKRRQARQNY